jgi:nucleoside-diphosphate-sugar epimerase
MKDTHIMKVLVTGGAGDIGSVGAAAQTKDNHDVVIVDNLPQEHRASMPPEVELGWTPRFSLLPAPRNG